MAQITQISCPPWISQIFLPSLGSEVCTGYRKNLRDQGWAGNLRYLRNLRGAKKARDGRMRSMPLTMRSVGIDIKKHLQLPVDGLARQLVAHLIEQGMRLAEIAAKGQLQHNFPDKQILDAGY